mmetsp:Transcript_156544/g.502435  ORF Transcript_156544/g.502435 Transcript_156544/m.502435 type:complete len:266 (+) Transcript_156544:1441-2238(+)
MAQGRGRAAVFIRGGCRGMQRHVLAHGVRRRWARDPVHGRAWGDHLPRGSRMADELGVQRLHFRLLHLGLRPYGGLDGVYPCEEPRAICLWASGASLAGGHQQAGGETFGQCLGGFGWTFGLLRACFIRSATVLVRRRRRQHLLAPQCRRALRLRRGRHGRRWEPPNGGRADGPRGVLGAACHELLRRRVDPEARRVVPGGALRLCIGGAVGHRQQPWQAASGHLRLRLHRDVQARGAGLLQRDWSYCDQVWGALLRVCDAPDRG